MDRAQLQKVCVTSGQLGLNCSGGREPPGETVSASHLSKTVPNNHRLSTCLFARSPFKVGVVGTM